MRHHDDDYEDFHADDHRCDGDWVREYPEDNGKMVREFDPDTDYCELHACWKPYCQGESHKIDE